jgi:predicted permease
VAGIPLRNGRLLKRGDESDPAVVVVDEIFARRYFPNENPLGQQLRISGRPYEIVGIVGKVKLARLNEQEFRPYMYTPLTRSCSADITFVVRTALEPADMANAIRHALREVDPTRAILHTETMQRLVDDSIAPERLLTMSLAGFAGFALLLSALGVYGVLAFQVSQRTREMAIRMAFGARSRDVFQTVLHRGTLLIGLGLGIGLAGSLALCRLLSSFLFEVTPYDPATYVGALAFLAAVALLACYLPARRAANVDPMEALRAE